MMNTVIFASFILIICMLDAAEFSMTSSSINTPLEPKVYANLLRIRRKDQTVLIQKMLKDSYAKNYKMISIALEKIFQVIEQSNRTLTEEYYTPRAGFPTDQRKQDAVSSLLENTCLIADILMLFPDISYKLLVKTPNWKERINWSIQFVNEFPQIIDEQIVELMNLVYQEINENERSPNYHNPYRETKDTADSEIKKKPKHRKKLKSGPQLTRNEL